MWASSSYEFAAQDSGSFASNSKRIRCEGKFLVRGREKFLIKGVTYGTFRPNGKHHDYPDPQFVDSDFRKMRAVGINTVRLYTVPPRWLLDCAERNGLSVIVGLPWSQHIAFLDDRAIRRAIIRDVQDGVLACAGHPAVLAYSVGNEIPSQVVRWHGPRRIERFLAELYRTAKSLDPDALVTYANYPSTEYLELPFTDFSFYNVYLESTDAFDAYIARLQTRSDDKPLVLAELGFDSRRNGEAAQASALYDQITTALARGCAGVCVFAWTDEWHRGGLDVADWDFGLVGRQRHPKPALESVSRAFATASSTLNGPWPRISVVICTYNGAATIRDCLEGVAQVEYPDYEVIVVNDGSSDATASIVSEFDVRLFTTINQGLSAARNVGMRAATGEIIAYIDDDACPDPHWLLYLARTFQTTSHAIVGGPNLSPAGDGFIAQAVDYSPGNPVHIMIDDHIAEHIPGCNMAVRKAYLEAIGGFDPQFHVAGDDVDLCWRLQDRGLTIGFSPAAVVWHHRRNSIRAYWRQQIGYGRAEALLERKWPEKYNGIGHPIWSGRIYENSATRKFRRRQRIYQGVWGSAGYQLAHETPPSKLESFLSMPEWYLMLGALSLLTAMTPFWERMAVFTPALMIATTTTFVLAYRNGGNAHDLAPSSPLGQRIALRILTTFLHLLQPLARLWGRMSQGLTPWRHHNTWGYAWPRSGTFAMWTEEWRSTDERLRSLIGELQQAAYVVRCGDAYDRWDLEVLGGPCAGTRIQILVEEHGWGSQFVRFRYRPRYSRAALAVTGFFAALFAIAVWDGVRGIAALLALLTTAMMAHVLRQAASSTAATRTALVHTTRLTEQPATNDVEVLVGTSTAQPDMGGREEGFQPSNVTVLPETKRSDALYADIE